MTLFDVVMPLHVKAGVVSHAQASSYLLLWVWSKCSFPARLTAAHAFLLAIMISSSGNCIIPVTLLAQA